MPERRLAAILAADVVGYSRLIRADEEGTLAELARVREEVIKPELAARGGRVVKLMGDGILVEFLSAVEAVRAAIAIQTAMAEREAATEIVLRIGINLGDVVVDGDDLYGDGVNIAARLEGKADPGGICVADGVHEQVRDRLEVAFRDGGPISVRNIDRPVHAWHWSSGSVHAPSVELPSRPAIAVLPFNNMSADPEQEYFSDGVTEDIITELSRFSELFVIARNSSFQFKDQSVDIRDAAIRLGVQYVVEGSVRKAGNRVRVTAQLIDASAGAHLWADRYDRQLEDIFEVQDDVVRAIVGVLPGRIAAARAEGVGRKPTRDLTAFDYLLRGNHVLHRRGNAVREALRFYQMAVERDPNFAAAHAMIAIAEGMSVWDLSTYDDNPLERAYAAGKRAVELDGDDYRSHGGFGEALRQLGQHALARRHLERAMALNPNSAQVFGYWAMLQAYTGDQQGAVETYHRATKLDPFSQDNIRKEILAEAYYMLREYQKSIDVLETMLELPIFYVHQQLAMNYAQLGDTEARDRHMADYRSALPESYDEKLLFESHLRLCQREEDAMHWREGYRLSGMDV